MTKEVLIHVSGLHTPHSGEEQEEAPLELFAPGEYYYRNKTHYLLYEEIQEGFTEPVRNMIKIRPGFLEVKRRGPVNVQLIFEKDKVNVAYYRTPFGVLEMETAATRIWMKESGECLEIHAEYALGVNGEPVSNCVMNIRAVSRKEGNFRLT